MKNIYPENLYVLNVQGKLEIIDWQCDRIHEHYVRRDIADREVAVGKFDAYQKALSDMQDELKKL